MIRKLTCVMFTDIQGYTERMNREEKLGMELLVRMSIHLGEVVVGRRHLWRGG